MKQNLFLLFGLAAALVLTACSPNQNPEQIPPSPTHTIEHLTPSPSPTVEGELEVTASLTPEQGAVLEEPGYLPMFEPAECLGLVPEGFEAECGNLIVPENRGDLEGRQVSMHVVIFKSRSDNPLPDPLIYLTGGGGGNELDNTIRYLDDGMDAILEERDFIMYNQRGAKYSAPYLVCRGESSLMLDLATGDHTEEEQVSAQLDFFEDCRDNLVGRGIDLNQYNTAVNAIDFNDLRIALGYEQVNIYGTSYGSGLALAILRDYGEHIRSAIIDSVYPPQPWFYSEYGFNTALTFQRIFDACAADATCREQYPDLETMLYQVADELNANPRTFSTGMGDSPRLTYNGDDYLNALYMYPYVSMPGWVPRIVYEASRGHYGMVDNFIPFVLGTVPSDTISAGVQFSILCREEITPEAYALMIELNGQLQPQLASAMDNTINFEICELWDVDPAEAWESSPVVSDVPSLVFAGEFDPITPPEWAYLAAETLSNHYLYVIPGWGHGVMRSVPCGLEIGLQFLDDPTTEPDTSCIEEMPGIQFE
jgi:pimeloyl-ACP methyl ester carboxylesterase